MTVTRLGRVSKELIRRLLPKRIAPHKILSGPLRGSPIFTSWHDYPAAILGTTERALLDWFEVNAHPGETWLDIGAHYGYTAIALSKRVGIAGHVYAFEPVLATAACLERTRDLNRLNQMTVIAVALDAGTEIRTIELPAVRGMADSTAAHSKASEPVQCISLDSIWPFIGRGKPVHGVKIDVQGLELQVLLGMREFLVRWMPKLIIEFHSGVARREILEYLASVGYSAPIENVVPGGEAGVLLDDRSYAFRPEDSACAYSYTPLITSRS
jgi:FkbM family methyltransferase